MPAKVRGELQLCVHHDGGRGRWLPKHYFKSQKYTWCKRCYFADHKRPDRKTKEQELAEVIQLERTYTVNEQMRLYTRLSKTYMLDLEFTKTDVWEVLAEHDWTCPTCFTRRGINLGLKQALMNGGKLTRDNLVCTCNTCKLRLREKAYAERVSAQDRAKTEV